MDQRVEFVTRAISDKGPSFAELCREYGIAPKTGYKWKERFLAEGMAGLHDQSRRPQSSPEGLNEQVVCELVRLRQAHKTWGARKLLARYQQLFGNQGLPSESSVKRVLDHAGLVEHRRRRAAGENGRIQNRLIPTEPNELWTADFKGWWYTPTGQRCEPLTVRDAFSRYVLGVVIPPDARWQTIREAFERLFERYGLPGAIRSDNGRPFAAARAPLGLSRLSAWWLALGINLDRIAPGKPQENGAHERMHRDIASELERQIDGDLEEHAAAAEAWRRSYNEERPHEALGMRTPAELYRNSSRRYTGTPDHLDYPPGYLDRKVGQQGDVCVNGQHIFLTQALGGWNVGLKPGSQQTYAVYFGRLCLGELDVPRQSFTVWRPSDQEQ